MQHSTSLILDASSRSRLNLSEDESNAFTSPLIRREPLHHARTLRERYMIQLGYRPLRFWEDKGDDEEIRRLPREDPNLTPLLSRPAMLLVEQQDRKRPFFSPGGILSSIFNLSSAALGAGCLSLPYAFRKTGLLLGILLLIGAAFLTIYSMKLLIFCRNRTRLSTYEDLAAFCFGGRRAMIVDFSIILFCFGTCVAYIVAAYDIVCPVVEAFLPNHKILATKSFIMGLFVSCIMFPLSLVEHISSLRLPSLVGVLSICYLVLSVSINSIRHLIFNGLPVRFFDSPMTYLVHFDSGLFGAVSIIMFAFCCQVNVFSIYTELQRPSINRIKRIVNRSTCITFCLYALVGGFGFVRNLEATNPDILFNYPLIGDPMMALANMGMGVTVSLAFPFNVHPCRYTIEMLLFADREPSRLRFFLLTLGIVAPALFVAIFVPSIDFVFTFLGSTTASMVSFILPALFFNCIVPGPWYQRDKLCAWFLFAVGAMLGIVGTTLQIITARSK